MIKQERFGRKLKAKTIFKYLKITLKLCSFSQVCPSEYKFRKPFVQDVSKCILATQSTPLEQGNFQTDSNLLGKFSSDIAHGIEINYYTDYAFHDNSNTD